MARFDFDELFDQDYLHFYRKFINYEATEHEVDLIETLCGIEEGTRVLDVACGHGRIANPLAEAGAQVVGIDASEFFLERAREDAAERGVNVDYRVGDMRELSFSGEFDVVLSWFTAFGYFDDDTLRKILRAKLEALEPGGSLLIETINRDVGKLTTDERPSVKEIDGEFMLDLGRYDPHDGRLYVRRFVTRNEQKIRSLEYFIRLFTFTELRDWLEQAGFVNVRGFGGEGEVYRLDSARMILLAQRP